MTTLPERRWYVVYTQVHAETKAEINLNRQGFVTYLPRYLKRRRHARRLESVAAPLFPRYLFVELNLATQRWLAIRSTVGVSHFVCQGEQPTPVPEQVIDHLRNRENGDGLIHLSTRPLFQAGDHVRVVDGAFSACPALVEGMTDGERVAVLLELLGRKVRVVMDGGWIAAA